MGFGVGLAVGFGVGSGVGSGVGVAGSGVGSSGSDVSGSEGSVCTSVSVCVSVYVTGSSSAATETTDAATSRIHKSIHNVLLNCFIPAPPEIPLGPFFLPGFPGFQLSIMKYYIRFSTKNNSSCLIPTPLAKI